MSDSIWSILYASLPVILIRTYKENSATRTQRISWETGLSKITLVSGTGGFPPTHIPLTAVAFPTASSSFRKQRTHPESPWKAELFCTNQLDQPLVQCFLTFQKPNMTLILATTPEGLKSEIQEELLFPVCSTCKKKQIRTNEKHTVAKAIQHWQES